MPYQGTMRKPTSPAIIWIATRFIGGRTVARPDRSSSTRTLERSAIPLREVRAGLVTALEEVEHRLARGGGGTDLVVRKDELLEGGVVAPAHLRILGEPGRLRRSVRIKGRLPEAGSGPEAGADALVRIGFAGDDARA